MIDFSDALTAAYRRQQAGDFAGAEASYRHLLTQRPEDAWALFLLATLTLRRGDAAGTLQLLDQLLSNTRADADILRGVGDMYAALGQNLQALTAFGQGFQLATETGARDVAASFVQRIIANEHADARTLISIGNTCEALGRDTDAISAYQRALSILEPAEDDGKSIIDVTDRLLKFKQANADTMVAVGKALDSVGQNDRAIAALMRAIATNPATVEAYRLLATPMIEAGQGETLAQVYDRALRQFPAMHLDHADGFLRHQQAAIDRDIPGICIFTMPKTGTEFINARLCTALHVPRSRLSLHLFPCDIVIPSWCERVARGGTVVVEHVDANRRNLDRLAASGIKKIVVHVRDPRQATLSWLHHVETLVGDRAHFRRRLSPKLPLSYDNWDFAAKLDWQLKHHLPQLVRWTEDWLQVVIKHRTKIDVLFTHYRAFHQDEGAYFRSILDFYAIPHSMFREVMPVAAKETLHFRKGEIDEWVRVFSDRQQEMAARAIPKELARRFDWGN